MTHPPFRLLLSLPWMPLLVLWLCALPSQARAAGYYAFEIGPTAVGRAGANLVSPDDPSALWLNPAAITQARGLRLRLDGAAVWMTGSFQRDCGPSDDCGPRPLVRDYGEGRRYEIAAERAAPDGETVFAPQSKNLGRFRTPSDFSDGHRVHNEAGPQAIPGLWLTSTLDAIGLPDAAFGLAFFAPYAGDFAYGDDEYTRYSLIERDLLEAFYQATLAWRFGQWLAVGASVQGVSAGVRQQIKLSADRYGNENPDADVLVELNTMQHFIPSANAGLWSSPLPGLELGASVQLGREVRAQGPMQLLGYGPEIQELIDAGSASFVEDDPRATVSFTMPTLLRAGAKYGQQNLWEGLLDYEVEAAFVYEGWSSYDHVLLETAGIRVGQGGEPTPLEPIVQPRDWQDAWSLRLGAEVQLFDPTGPLPILVALRTGASYETAAIPNSSLNVELLNGEKVGVGAGLRLSFGGVVLDVGYGHLFVFDRVVGDESQIYLENPVRTFNPEPRTRVAMGAYRMSYDVLSVGLGVAMDDWFGESRQKTGAPRP